jgi:hypothetical protein
MTKTQHIADIARKLVKVRVADMAYVDEVVSSLAEPVPSPFPFTKNELSMIEQSKADFSLGRTYTWEESKRNSAAFMKRMQKKYAAA